MFRVVCVFCALFLGNCLFGMSLPEASREYNKLCKIGTVSADGSSVTISRGQLNDYYRSNPGEVFTMPRKLAMHLVDKNVARVVPLLWIG